MLDLDQLDELRPGLVRFCYRMLGSVFEAEDAAQETVARAWQSRASFQREASLRTWLYRIATNICVDLLRSRARRAVPMDFGPASPVAAIASAEPSAQPWISPFPGRTASGDGDPAELVISKETIRLAFVAALQHLPARQRAVLILRDVLSWPAAEVGELLGASVPSVNSALQRARSTIGNGLTSESPDDLAAFDRELLSKYVSAFERYDIDALVGLLQEDAIQSMPPFPMWLQGATSIGSFMLGPGAECRGSRLVPTVANGSPAFGQYRRDPKGGYLPWSLQVLEVRAGRVAELHCFLDTALFPVFGLPTSP
jgi:RNA polymerase sigma-70 factor, ECF subfamily